MRPTLRPYQKDVIDRVRTRISEGAKRVVLQGATGSGKTVTSGEIVSLAFYKGKRVLFLAHRRILITQKSRVLDLYGCPHGVIMDGVAGDARQLVQVGSKDTLLSRSVRNEWRPLPQADLVIVDEAHGCVAEEYQRLLDFYRNSVIVGLTATPARSDGRSLAPYFQALECTVPTSQLVREGYLVPVTCYSQAVTKNGRPKKGLAGDPVEHWKRLAQGRPTVLFTTKVSNSLGLVERFVRAGVKAEHIDAHTKEEDRRAIIDRVKSGQTQVVCNVGIWTEGVDIPELSCCILYRVCNSYVFYAQAVGRIMRPAPGKSDALLLDHSGAVLRHGFPDDDVQWSLDENSTVEERNKAAAKDRPDRKPIICESCQLIYRGSWACPNCGHCPRRGTTTQERQFELLTRVDRHGEKLTDDMLLEKKRRHWMECLAMCARTGKTAGVASAMYKRAYRKYPEQDLRGVCPDHIPYGNQWRELVSKLYPGFLDPAGRKRSG
jgi:DNA repair protein RadD